MLANASWSGVCKLWNVSDCNLVRTLRGHSTHVRAITWCPTANMDLDNGEMCLASCASDGRGCDRRTSQCIMFLDGHLKGVTGHLMGITLSPVARTTVVKCGT